MYRALPISSALIRAGTYGNCSGIALARIDLEAATGYEFVDATAPPSPGERDKDDKDLIDLCVTHVREGIEAELTDLFHALPAVRVVLHRVHPHPIDAHERVNQNAGRYVLRQALLSAGLGETCDVPAPGPGYLLVRPS